MFEPPAKTCAAPPSMPGRAKTPRFSSWSGQPGASASAGARIDHLTQLGAESCSVVPSQNGTSGLVSLPSLRRGRRVRHDLLRPASRPASDSALESCASHSRRPGRRSRRRSPRCRAVRCTSPGRASRCPTCRGSRRESLARWRRTRRASSEPSRPAAAYIVLACRRRGARPSSTARRRTCRRTSRPRRSRAAGRRRRARRSRRSGRGTRRPR